MINPAREAHLHRAWLRAPFPALLACLAFLLVAFAPVSLRAADTWDPAGVDAILADTLRFWKVPGMAVAIVRDDKVIYLNGVGVRQKGKPEPVTPDTVFPIGSVTKAFTATAIGLLIDDGKASWDDPVRKHVPFFRLADPLADRDVTLRDLLSHRTGIARHDNLWYRAPWSIEETVRRMGQLQPSAPFRSTYLYNNIAYIASGLAVSSASGSPWQEFVRRRLCEPLNMRQVVFTRSEILQTPDHAMPHHAEGSDVVSPIDFYDDDKQIRASGSIKTCARDLANWARLQLSDGVFEGKRVISARVLAETHTPQIVAPLDPELARLAGTTQVSYGLGWRIYDYRGQPVLDHGGAVDGFRARVLLLPRKRIGVVLLANLDVLEMLWATGNRLADHLLELPPVSWNTHYREQLDRQEEAARKEQERRLRSRRPNTRPSRELDAYAGSYHEPAYGTVQVTVDEKDKNRLKLSWSSWIIGLEHFHYDTFLYHGLGKPGQDLVTFALRSDGAVGTLSFLGRTFVRKARE
jgi:CubicO group peptidase (beta-lactamase class C family)